MGSESGIWEHNEMCWYQQDCVHSMNKFFDQNIKSFNGLYHHEHMKALENLLSLCKEGRLLDIGTGTGMVSALCGNFEFNGCDLPHIVAGCAMRNYPQYFYRGCDIIEDDVSWIKQYDILVLNAVIDIMANPLGVLRKILSHAKKYVIIHRQEITKGESTTYTINPSYNSNTFHSIISRKDLDELLSEMQFEIIEESALTFGNWEDGGRSFLLKNKNFKDKKYESYPLRQLKNRIINQHESKIVLGAGDQPHPFDWICTNQEELDIENKDDWGFLFDKTLVTHFLAEHVWEHLRDPDKANKNVFNHLYEGGRLRIAVPDGFHPDQDYIDHVKPGGSGAGADDHQHLWNYITLTESLQKAGFTVNLLEYWDGDGNFHTPITWLRSDGFIKRSFKFDDRNKDGKPNYTSLIVDAFRLKE